MQTDFDAVIVGAGPAGSTAAILLARAGWSVALVEKQRFPRRKVCGECVAASNLPLLEALGIGPEFAASAGPDLRQVALMSGERTVIADLPAADAKAHAWGRALGRETLDTLLLAHARAAGVAVLQPWSVQALEGVVGDYRCEVRAIESARHETAAHETAVAMSTSTMTSATASATVTPSAASATSSTATSATSATLRAPVAIDAHGSWEPLPSGRATRRLYRRSGDLFAFKANFRGAALAEGLLPVLSFAGGYGGMVVADHGVTTLACCIREDRLDACRRAAPGMRAGDVVEALLKRECRGVEAALGDAQRDGAWLASGPLDPGIRLTPGDELFRIGNAAGEAHPIIGEGISMALQSAWLLCARLLECRQPGGTAASRVGASGVFSADHERVCGTGRDGLFLSSAAWQREVQGRYAADWRRHFASRLRLAAAYAQLAMRPAAAAPLFALLKRWPALMTLGARCGGKVRCAPDPVTIDWLAAGALSKRADPAPHRLLHRASVERSPQETP